MVFLSQTSSLHNFMTNHRHHHPFISTYSSILYVLNSLFMCWLWLFAPFVVTLALNIAIASFKSSCIQNRIKSIKFLTTNHHRNHTCQTKQSFFLLVDAFLPDDLQIHSPTHDAHTWQFIYKWPLFKLNGKWRITAAIVNHINTHPNAQHLTHLQ